LVTFEQLLFATVLFIVIAAKEVEREKRASVSMQEGTAESSDESSRMGVIVW